MTLAPKTRFYAITTAAILAGLGAASLAAVQLNRPQLPVVVHDLQPPTEPTQGLQPLIPQGYRAVTVRVNDVVGVAGFILPGSHVDVIATAGDQHDVLSRIVLSDVLVLASGSQHNQAKKVDHPIETNVVTLALEPSDAERLVIVTDKGRINLALRTEGDHVPSITPGSHLASVMSDVHPFARPVAKRVVQTVIVHETSAPAPVYSVQTVKGSKQGQEVVK